MSSEVKDSLENEFYTEINNKNVSISALKSFGITDLTLKEEVMLRNIYGDKILENEDNLQVDTTKKVVEKINLNEIEQIDEVKAFIEKLFTDENNTNIEVVLAKIKQEEDEWNTI